MSTTPQPRVLTKFSHFWVLTQPFPPEYPLFGEAELDGEGEFWQSENFPLN